MKKSHMKHSTLEIHSNHQSGDPSGSRNPTEVGQQSPVKTEEIAAMQQTKKLSGLVGFLSTMPFIFSCCSKSTDEYDKRGRIDFQIPTMIF
jgi:hypothetical protein